MHKDGGGAYIAIDGHSQSGDLSTPLVGLRRRVCPASSNINAGRSGDSDRMIQRDHVTWFPLNKLPGSGHSNASKNLPCSLIMA